MTVWKCGRGGECAGRCAEVGDRVATCVFGRGVGDVHVGFDDVDVALRAFSWCWWMVGV